MSKRMTLVVPAILVILHAAALSTARSSFAQRVADDCISKPTTVPPQGRHWYYRLDRAAQRQCWYLGPQGAKAQASARQAELPMRLPAPRPLLPPPAATPAEMGADRNEAAANFALRWTDLPRPLGLTSNGYAEDPSATDPEDDMPSVWPVLAPAELMATQPQAEHTFGSKRILAIFAGALAFAAVMVCSVWRRPGAGTPARSVREHRPRERMLLVPANRLSRPGDSGRDAGERALPRQAGLSRAPRPAAARRAWS
jgi:hypothetical protein